MEQAQPFYFRPCKTLPEIRADSWSTIGYLADLDRVDVNDLKQFFLRWYGPNNATLTIAGDVKPAEVLKLAEKYFEATWFFTAGH